MDSTSNANLSGMSPMEIAQYLMQGGSLSDTPETAAKIVTTLMVTKGPYHEVVFLGNEICVRTHCRRHEAGRVPLTLGGVLLLMSHADHYVNDCMMWIAQGGDNGF